MLQFRTNPHSNKYTVPEQVQMAIEGGIQWIEMSADYESRDSLREDLIVVMPMCEEEKVILTVDHDIEIVKEMKVHGVHLYPGDMLPAEAREYLGPHAFIGVSVKTAAEIIALKKADIDFVEIGNLPNISLAEISNISTEEKLADVTIPIVVGGNVSITDIRPVIEAGANGIVLSESALVSENPVDFFREAKNISNSFIEE